MIFSVGCELFLRCCRSWNWRELQKIVVEAVFFGPDVSTWSSWWFIGVPSSMSSMIIGEGRVNSTSDLDTTNVVLVWEA
jgi:hypothetical protein